MDPGRKAMIEGRNSPRARDITSARRDPTTRISKPYQNAPSPAKHLPANYLTEDEQARRFVADEDKFVLRQSKKKADIRVREGRAKPIDLLAFNLRSIDPDRDVFDDEDADVTIEVPPPEAVLGKLGEEDIKALDTDIASYLTLETNERNRGYWRSLATLCEDRRRRLKGPEAEARAVSIVAEDIDKIMAPKSLDQLEALEKQIRAKLQSDEPIDTDYWEQLLKILRVWKARASLQKTCEAIKAARVENLQRLGLGVAAPPESDQPTGSAAGPSAGSPSSAGGPKTGAAPGGESSASAPPPGTARFAQSSEDFSQTTKALYEREAARGVGENEEIFAAEEAVPSSAKPQWADKYRPRKPRYFNRVQMGYEWNKYNQTHYDHDNPPPKVVQGYKFNIFYPELIDKTKAPTFKIIREGGRRRGESFAPAGEEDTCLIRFIAGPPYEDIAFRIVDREWDYSAKKDRGFRSIFDKVRTEHARGFARCAANIRPGDPPAPFPVQEDILSQVGRRTPPAAPTPARFGHGDGGGEGEGKALPSAGTSFR